MANKFNLQISIVLFISSVFFLHPPPHASADIACPYPCYPTPTGGVPTTTTTPPSTQTGSSYNYPPPGAFVNTPPSTGYLPYYPPPSGYGGGYGPPPPDPILPYFPYYFKNGLHKDQPPSSSSPSPSLFGDHVVVIIMAWVVIFVLNLHLF